MRPNQEAIGRRERSDCRWLSTLSGGDLCTLKVQVSHDLVGHQNRRASDLSTTYLGLAPSHEPPGTGKGVHRKMLSEPVIRLEEEDLVALLEVPMNRIGS